MTNHVLKVRPGYFEDIKNGIKTFELRKADRDYQEGDVLELKEFDPLGAARGGYTGRALAASVTYIIRGPAFGLEAGFVCMGIKPEGGGGFY